MQCPLGLILLNCLYVPIGAAIVCIGGVDIVACRGSCIGGYGYGCVGSVSSVDSSSIDLMLALGALGHCSMTLRPAAVKSVALALRDSPWWRY